MHLQLYGKKIWVFRKPIDFRRSIDGLVNFITQDLQLNPQEGIYLFYSKSKNKIKCLSWHKNGFVLIYKRLEKGKFFLGCNETGGIEIDEISLTWLMAGLEWQKMRQWKELNFDKFS